MRIEFTVPGPPRGKGRPRHSARGGVVRMHTAPEDIALEKKVKAIVRQAFGPGDPWTCPIRIRIVSTSAIPASWPKRYREALLNGNPIYGDGKPDGDNIEKSIWDACNELVWRDDAQVVEWSGLKRYGSPDRIDVVIEPVLDAMGLPPMLTPAQIEREKVTWAELCKRKADAKAARAAAAKARKQSEQPGPALFRQGGKPVDSFRDDRAKEGRKP